MKEIVINSFGMHVDAVRQLVSDVPNSDMYQQPLGVPNHPAWTLGHLAYSFESIGEEIGLSRTLPGDWGARFGTGSVPATQGDNGLSKPQLLQYVDEAGQRVRSRLVAMSAEDFSQPLPDVRYRDVFPTIGHAVTHILVGHTAVHIGQLMVWRRAMGLPTVTQVL